MFIKYAVIPTLCPMKLKSLLLFPGLARVMECEDRYKPVPGVLTPLMTSSGLVNLLAQHTMAFKVRVSHRKHYAFKRGKQKSSWHAKQDVTYTRLATSSRFISIKLCVSSETLHMRLCAAVYNC